MLPIDPERQTGPWQGRVRFGPGGTFAYRPGEILIRDEVADFAEERLHLWIEERQADSDEEVDLVRDEESVAESYTRLRGSFEVWEAVDHLREQGVAAQVNHVLFATPCCPPHPSDPEAESFYANPFYANPFYANPFYANAGCTCVPRCGCGCGAGASANPFYANPFYANPFYANADRSPFANAACQHSGSRESSARPAAPPLGQQAQAVAGVRIAILDTGWAATNPPTGLDVDVIPHGGDQPDEDGDGFLDPAAGHGTFIAGIIEQVAPGCQLEVIEVLSTFGEGDEAEISQVLSRLARRPDDQRPHLVNLSFGGYSPTGMGALSKAISDLHDAGTVVVASAGNDATCMPLLPAALPDVIAVGAIDDEGKPAKFTNYGPWVEACAPGVDVVSLFFEGFDGAGPAVENYDPDRFEGWARWSGTSFAAPRVVAELAREIAAGVSPADAVVRLIRDKDLPGRPMLGTIVGWEEPAAPQP